MATRSMQMTRWGPTTASNGGRSSAGSIYLGDRWEYRLSRGDLALRAQRWALFSAWWGQYRGPVVKAWTEDARRKAPQSGGNAERA
jgi:hypothetical protein